MRTFSAQSGSLPKHKGFTLIELLVVISIMVTMLALAANMMKGGGRGQGLQSAVQLVDDMVQEARQTAMGKCTWSRLVVISTPDNESRNMRTIGVISKHNKTNKWVLENRYQTLPQGFYVSPKYSTALDTAVALDKVPKKSGKRKKASRTGFGSADCQDSGRLPGYKDRVEYYFIEFDAEGRMSHPTEPTRLVVVAGTAGDGDEENPSPVKDGKPGMAAGIVIYPKGHTGRLRTDEQVIPD